jgi:hypothetical protein
MAVLDIVEVLKMDFAVHVVDLVKVYDGRVRALDSVSLDVRPRRPSRSSAPTALARPRSSEY